MSFYAVANVRQMGIFRTLEEAKLKVDGFIGTKIKKFDFYIDALNFILAYIQNIIALNKDLELPKLNNEATKTNENFNYEDDKNPQFNYYAVARGRRIGIYSTWAETEQQIENYRFPKYKKFKTEIEANEFIELYKIKTSNDIIKENYIEHNNVVDIYCDGSVPNNGHINSEGGIGILFGQKEISEKVPKIYGSITNNISELYALLRVFEIIEIELQLNNSQFFRIFTDSQYSILSITEWSKIWKQNNWMNSLNQPVKNAHIIKIILDKYEELKVYCELYYFEEHTNNDSTHFRGNNKANELARMASSHSNSFELNNNSLKRKIEVDNFDLDLKKIKII